MMNTNDTYAAGAELARALLAEEFEDDAIIAGGAEPIVAPYLEAIEGKPLARAGFAATLGELLADLRAGIAPDFGTH